MSFLPEVKKKPRYLNAHIDESVFWVPFSFIILSCLFLQNSLSENDAVGFVLKICRALPLLNQYASRTEFPVAFLIGYGSAFYLGWIGSIYLYLRNIFNKKVRVEIDKYDRKERRMYLIMFFVILALAIWPDSNYGSSSGVGRSIVRNRAILAIFSGGVYFINLMSTTLAIFIFEYYIRRCYGKILNR
ncbi:hypothetical protein [Paraburkholderia bonniea]|uniref:hypothetical protein n=1 Tax=Paraburkholderia bonniea TaxID=2152891 RepID=UPI001290E0C6|nr:hypothetical protein [Paraburkholderia bonniea]